MSTSSGEFARPAPFPAISKGLHAFEAALRRAGYTSVAGVDEAGRGACAGPLVVASCVLKPRSARALPGLDDSKRLTAQKREWLEPRIREQSLGWHVVVMPPAEVDAMGVHQANLEGMRRAVAGLAQPPDYVLMDGFDVPGMPSPAQRVVGGDRLVACIAAASVLAKVARDRIMVALDQSRSGYGFAAHKGYCTAAHMSALAQFGPCEHHRYSYAPVAAARR
ncbi:Ribonuclease H [Segniliparus rotundus DSM 44985]|uniref:Ribonuclease HII n=1 Tax=Segniliparus rotundus (strain ATCC BAA-972 / CDC 1076 / CIP 108378 / DSM 44985 / JCM 13578) TaxID=640132 RepID=D6Z8Z1_SEGRD|nr:ribonuclease HII [Segniliparus rotundus]ADG98421.1 Ribonuclease H [Segniliparus rotundus DSM 44985]